MKLKRTGFFREMRHGLQTDPSLVEAAKTAKPFDDVSRVVAYLQNGTLFIASPGIVKDVLNEGGKVIGAPHVRTDGVWTWPSDFAYYVKHYGINVPQDFLEHMERNQWQPRTLQAAELKSLEIEGE
jgi:hypothetical protein